MMAHLFDPRKALTSTAFALVAALVTLLIGTGAAHACVCTSPPNLDEVLKRSDAVFYGTVLSVGPQSVRVRALRHYKDAATDPEIDVHFPSNDCRPDFEQDGRYLVFAWRDDNGKWKTGDRCEVPTRRMNRPPISPHTRSIVNISRHEDPQVRRSLRTQRTRITKTLRESVTGALRACETESNHSIDLRYVLSLGSDGEFTLAPAVDDSELPLFESDDALRSCFVRKLLEAPTLQSFDGQDVDIRIHAVAEWTPYVELLFETSSVPSREPLNLLAVQPVPPRVFSLLARLWDADITHNTVKSYRASEELIYAGYPEAALLSLSGIKPQTALEHAFQAQALAEAYLVLSNLKQAAQYCQEASLLTEGYDLRTRYLAIVLGWGAAQEAGNSIELLSFAAQRGWDEVSFKRLALGAARTHSFLDWAALANLWEAEGLEYAWMAHAMAVRSGSGTPVLLNRATTELKNAAIGDSFAPVMRQLGRLNSNRAAASGGETRGVYAINRAVMLSREITPETPAPRPWTPPVAATPPAPTEFAAGDPMALLAAIAIVLSLGLVLRRAL